MLRHVLNCEQDLLPSWHLDYGVTSRRNATLLAPLPERNSFAHPGSETALTLFMLGNLDRWKQIGSFGSEPPRTSLGDRWNTSLFDQIRGDGVINQFSEPLWERVGVEPFIEGTLDFKSS